MFLAKLLLLVAAVLVTNVLAGDIKYEARWVDSKQKTHSDTQKAKIADEKLKIILDNMAKWSNHKYKAIKISKTAIEVTNSIRPKTKEETSRMIGEMTGLVALNTKDKPKPPPTVPIGKRPVGPPRGRHPNKPGKSGTKWSEEEA
ncbi:hypothetical protein ANO11243_009630 [Dothideomycetidae sp. 11243]|nr:hypothetical protein ANO11243_009630 [fungal sp. No.11243]